MIIVLVNLFYLNGVIVFFSGGGYTANVCWGGMLLICICLLNLKDRRELMTAFFWVGGGYFFIGRA